MITYGTHELDGIDFLVSPITFDNLTGATSMVGGTVGVEAITTRGGLRYTGVATLVNASTGIRCTFAPRALPPGVYSVQVRATPAGYAQQTISDTVWVVKTSAKAGP